MRDGCSGPRYWKINVGDDDNVRLREIVERRRAQTGESTTGAGTIRRAVRELHDRECGEGDAVE